MASVASQLIEEVTVHVQSDSLEDAREICADGIFRITYVYIYIYIYTDVSEKHAASSRTVQDRLREEQIHLKRRYTLGLSVPHYRMSQSRRQ